MTCDKDQSKMLWILSRAFFKKITGPCYEGASVGTFLDSIVRKIKILFFKKLTSEKTYQTEKLVSRIFSWPVKRKYKFRFQYIYLSPRHRLNKFLYNDTQNIVLTIVDTWLCLLSPRRPQLVPAATTPPDSAPTNR